LPFGERERGVVEKAVSVVTSRETGGPKIKLTSKLRLNQVRKSEDGGFIALWRGQRVRSVDGANHHFPTRKEAR
jgi:hypothetical protein